MSSPSPVPCYHCGEPATLCDDAGNGTVERDRDGRIINRRYQVICESCGTSGPRCEEPEDALAFWNKIKRPWVGAPYPPMT